MRFGPWCPTRPDPPPRVAASPSQFNSRSAKSSNVNFLFVSISVVVRQISSFVAQSGLVLCRRTMVPRGDGPLSVGGQVHRGIWLCDVICADLRARDQVHWFVPPPSQLFSFVCVCV